MAAEPLSDTDTHAIVRAVAGRYRIRKGAGYERADLVQAGWIGAMKARKDFDGSTPFRAYLHLRVQWEINDHLERAWHRTASMPGVETEIVSLDALPDAERAALQAPKPRGPIEAREAREFIRRLARGLSREHRLIALRYFARRQRVTEIARRMGADPSDVSKALRVHVLPHMRGKYRAVLARFDRLELDQRRPGRVVDARGREVFRSFRAFSEALASAG